MDRIYLDKILVGACDKMGAKELEQIWQDDGCYRTYLQTANVLEMAIMNEHIWKGISATEKTDRYYLPDGWLKLRYYNHMVSTTNRYRDKARRGH